MPLPDPVPGLVIGYAFLWRHEAARGHDEGRKDRPCVIILSVRRGPRDTMVTVAPITHATQTDAGVAVEIPLATKRRLGLDDARSWIIADDLNQFVWPGVDLRPTARDTQAFAYGLLPSTLYREVRERVLALARHGRARLTSRD